MREQIMRRRVLTLCAVLFVAAPLSAQQAAPPDPAARQLMYQVQTFEGILQSAVKHGADVLAQRVSVEVPGIQLTSNDPEAKGFSMPTPEGGLFFVVIIPGVRGIVPLLVGQQFPRPIPQMPVSARPGSGAPVNAQAMPNADPMTVSPTIPDGASSERLDVTSATTLDREYSKAVANALIDAVIDNSGVLPLKESEWLTVAAIDGVAPTPGVVNNAFGHTLYISVKGVDLLQYRQTKISRDELRDLVKVKQN